MTQPPPPAHPIHDAPANGPALDPNTLIALLHSIGAGAASDGQPLAGTPPDAGPAHRLGGYRLLLGRPSRGAGDSAGAQRAARTASWSSTSARA